MAKVLIVEDSDAELAKLVDIVSNLGHEVLVARTGEEGVIVAAQEQPAVIVMDVVMPGVNGFQATRQIKHSPDTRHIPIIIVSVKSQAVDIAWGERQGADSYLVKPVQPRELNAAIQTVLSEAPPANEETA